MISVAPPRAVRYDDHMTIVRWLVAGALTVGVLLCAARAYERHAARCAVGVCHSARAAGLAAIWR